MDEIFKPFQPRGPLLPQSSMLEVLQECFGEWTKQIKPWKHKFNQVMFNIDLWGSGVGDSYWYMGLNIWSIYCSSGHWLPLWEIREHRRMDVGWLSGSAQVFQVLTTAERVGPKQTLLQTVKASPIERVASGC